MADRPLPTSNAADKLRAARELIARPGGWTQREFAKDARGHEISEHRPEAVCFCPMGALFRVHGFGVGVGHLRRAIGAEGIPASNDAPGRTQAEVVAAFDRAIEIAEAAHG